ncbi:MAG: NDP-sugar synthase [Desulfovibrio sp.]|jgi:mannose-1-phosphate guanylyltransferase|nr:NDP-sugar synthase [Desulfovibrio sp.]
MKAVIQAGGKGTRLRPYTLVLPKPLVPVGEMPIIEVLFRWLKRNGVTESCVTLGYLGELIRAVCRDGSQWELPIQYVQEQEPLGTIGALRLVDREWLDGPFFCLNGDVLTDVNLRAMVKFHGAHGGPLTVAMARKSIHVDLGVMDVLDGRVTGFREKPTLGFSVSMGVYCMDPAILDIVPTKVAFGFDDLMYTMLDKELPVYVYPHDGLWMDIGRPEDYHAAQEVFEENRMSILGV